MPVSSQVGSGSLPEDVIPSMAPSASSLQQAAPLLHVGRAIHRLEAAQQQRLVAHGDELRREERRQQLAISRAAVGARGEARHHVHLGAVHLRTAATTVTAVKHLAPSAARDATIVGCGALGRFHAQALRECLGYERLRFFDTDAQRARALATWASDSLGVKAAHCASIPEATLPSNVVVTCTSSQVAFLGPEDLKPGALVAGVGADNPHKAELLPALLASARLVDGAVRGELAKAIRGVSARAAGSERVVFRSTGLAIEDLALCALLVEKCGIDCG